MSKQVHLFKNKQGYIRNATSTFYDGYSYDSKKEAGYAQMLDIRIKAKDIKDWSRQYPIKVLINGKWIFTYKIDFKIIHNDDSIELIEVKGFATSAWLFKWKIVDAIYSGASDLDFINPDTIGCVISVENYEPAELTVVK